MIPFCRIYYELASCCLLTCVTLLSSFIRAFVCVIPPRNNSVFACSRSMGSKKPVRVRWHLQGHDLRPATEHGVANPLARYGAIIYTRQYGDAEPVQICEVSA